MNVEAGSSNGNAHGPAHALVTEDVEHPDSNPHSQSGSEHEQSRLDTAMRRADDILVASLRRDERRRRRRRVLIAASTGGLIMLAIGIIWVTAAALLAPAGGKDKSQPNTGDAPRAAALSAEGWKLWQQRKLADAEAKFAEAVKLDAKNANAWNGLGWSQFNQGKAREAADAFRKAVGIAEDHPAALNGLGQVLLFQKKYDEAEKHLLKAAAHDASAAYFGLARLYLLKRDFKQALPWAILAAREAPQEPSSQTMLRAAKQQKLTDEARKQLEPPGEEPR